MEIDRSAKKISDSYTGLLAAVLLLILAAVILELAGGVLSGIETYKIYNFSKTLGGFGAFLAFTAVAFFFNPKDWCPPEGAVQIYFNNGL